MFLFEFVALDSNTLAQIRESSSVQKIYHNFVVRLVTAADWDFSEYLGHNKVAYMELFLWYNFVCGFWSVEFFFEILL